MATYLARDALRLPAASLLANSGLCVNIEFEISLLLGVNVATTFRVRWKCGTAGGSRAWWKCGADLPIDWRVSGAIVRTCGSTDLHTDMRGCIRIYPADFTYLTDLLSVADLPFHPFSFRPCPFPVLSLPLIPFAPPGPWPFSFPTVTKQPSERDVGVDMSLLHWVWALRWNSTPTASAFFCIQIANLSSCRDRLLISVVCEM